MYTIKAFCMERNKVHIEMQGSDNKLSLCQKFLHIFPFKLLEVSNLAASSSKTTLHRRLVPVDKQFLKVFLLSI